MSQRCGAIIAFVLATTACCSLAHAGLTIVPTFSSSITSDPHAATIESTIDTAIGNLDADIANNMTVHITFGEMTSGLGDSSTSITEMSYATYLNDLKTRQIHSAADNTAIATLPNTTNNPANGSASIMVTTALYQALNGGSSGNPESTIEFNESLVDNSLGTPSAGLYSLESVVTHEMDEALGGVGGPTTTIGLGTAIFADDPAGVTDLFRYGAPGVRSYTTSSFATAYFSINSGVTDLVNFNQAGGGSDYADWATGASPQVQDAFGSPGTDPQLGSNEITSFDVVGYNLTAQGLALESVPEPSRAYLLLGGLLALAFHRRSRKST